MTMPKGLLGAVLAVLSFGKDALAEEWPFTDARTTAVFTTAEIVDGKAPILSVYRDREDGSWQFHSDGEADPEKAKVVGLEQIVKIDPSIKELADLPKGWMAERKGKKKKWERFEDTDE